MNTKNSATAKVAPEVFFATMTLPDLASALSALSSMRTTANLTSNLANHMRRADLEDFADSLCEALGDQVEAIEIELRSRNTSDPAEIAHRDELLFLAASLLRPGEAGANIRVGSSSNV